MSLMQETVLDRLWTKYEHRFGHPPPIASASFEEAISKIRMALDGREAGPAVPYRHNEINNSGGMPIQAP
ncbi:MAG: hypothetical protein WD767_00225 [Alphaproteobacteria bacterium]